MDLLVLSAEDVATAISSLTSDELQTLMAKVFVRLHFQDRITMPHRTSIRTDEYDALFMPARIEPFNTAIKIVSVPATHGKAGVHATTVILDELSGAVRAVINATALTAVRTAAGSALATRLLGPSNPRTLLVFGAGRQIESHVDLLVRSFPSLTRCIIVNRSRNSRLENLHATLQHRFSDIIFESGDASVLDLEQCVSSADIICTATPSRQPLFKTCWVKEGTHINLVGSYTPDMVEVEADLIRRAGRVLVDSREACMTEAGDLIRAEIGPENMIQVGEIVEPDGKAIPDAVQTVKEAGNITLYKSVGVGLQDTAIAGSVLDKATAIGLGTRVAGYN